MTDNRVEVCHVCGGPLFEKRVAEASAQGAFTRQSSKLTAKFVSVAASRFSALSTVRRFEEIRRKLAQQQTAEFVPIGQTFQVSQMGEPIS